MSKPRRVAIVHYHLRGGGVTRVIENAVDSLNSNGIQSVVICGEKPRHSNISQLIVHEKLTYNQTIPEIEIGHIFRELEQSAIRALGGKPDIWHIHNHNLGKNQVLPLLVNYMAGQGIPLFLQIHDFPEDGRPKNYHYLLQSFQDKKNIGEILYPVADHIYYGTLNRRDYRFLNASGIPETQLRLIPNAVILPETTKTVSSHKAFDAEYERLILYPTRAIRRKNIGEFLLHALLANTGDLFAVTLAPKNPKARPLYERWVQFSESLSLPVRFEAGRQSTLSFPQLLHAADLIMTTSIAEGFGLAFLEPWLAESKLYGRDLPDITDDFTKHGIDLSSLYNQLKIPLKWLDTKMLKGKIRKEISKVYQQYNLKISENELQKAWEQFKTDREYVDFGRLDEQLQENILLKLHKNPDLKSELQDYSYRSDMIDDQTVQQNKRIIENEYHLKKYGEYLTSIYESLLEQNPGNLDYMDANELLQQFINPSRFNLLRT